MMRNLSSDSQHLPSKRESSAFLGEPKTIKRLRSGDLLKEVDRETHSTKLLAITELAQVPVKVSPHRTLNTSKGVLRTPELKNTTREELLTQLKKQGVTDARMVTIKKKRRND